MKSSPVISADIVLVGSYDANLYALRAADGKLVWKVQTRGYVHATPAIVAGVAYVTGCDEILRGIRIADGKEVLTLSSGAYTGASPAVTRRACLLRHVRERGARRRSEGEKDPLEIQAPGAEFPVPLVGGAFGEPGVCRRSRQDGACASIASVVRQHGRSWRARESIHRQRSPAVAPTSARTTASCTGFESRLASASSNSTPAVRCPPPPLSPPDGSLSARTTGSCSVWAKGLRVEESKVEGSQGRRVEWACRRLRSKEVG